MSEVHHAVVKYVVSGDTLAIKPISTTNGGDTEQRISFNYVTAPKLARPPSRDEPYAFDSREYLRKRLVGQEISYTIDFQIPKSGRCICTVFLGPDRENIIESLLSEGLVTLRSPSVKHATDATYQRLVLLDQQAQVEHRGLHSTDPASAHVRDLKCSLDDPKEFLHRHRLPLNAIVESIRDGNTVRCLLVPNYHLVSIQLTGITCPMLKQQADAISSIEAKRYVEDHLLQREVKVVLHAVNHQNLVGRLMHLNGDIALCLLREGLARCVDWSLVFLPQAERERYRAVEAHAKDHGLNIWNRHVAPVSRLDFDMDDGDASGGSPSEEYEAKVLEISNGDGLTVRDLRDGKTRRIHLSSVRAPRASDFQRVIKRQLYDVPYLFQAREFLRKHSIGQTVRVVTDYIQPATHEYPEKIFCTVYIESQNLGELLISQGLAKAVRHRQDDKGRSPHYDDLLIAEHRAETGERGLFSVKNGLCRTIDITGEANKERARGLLSALQGNGRMQGVIESVISGSHFRVHLLQYEWIISFFLSSIHCPRSDPVHSDEPFNAEAVAFSKEHFFQRDAFVEVESVNRSGSFTGRLTLMDGQSAALILLRAGLAKLHHPAQHASDYQQLLTTEAESRKERLGMWVQCEDAELPEIQPNIPQPERSMMLNLTESGFRRVLLTYISSDFTIYVHHAEQGQILEQLQCELREHFSQLQSQGEHAPRKGHLIAARSNADDQWYRARVQRIQGKTRVHVNFIDYGNSEVISDLNRLAALPPSLSNQPAQVHAYELAYVRPLPAGDARQAALSILTDQLGAEECLMTIEYTQNEAQFISLHHADTNENLLKRWVEQGLLKVTEVDVGRQAPSTPLYDALKRAARSAQ